jgi:hypothetical protein
MCEDNTNRQRNSSSAPSRQRPETLYLREGDRIVEAPAAMQAIAREYTTWIDKGEVSQGRRLTIMTRPLRYTVGEPIPVIHVLEATEPGVELYIMGPKPIYGEYLDGRLVTEPAPAGDEPWAPVIYDGPVLSGPGVDFNYEITTYVFQEPGVHQLHWQLGNLRSNTLQIEIVDG